MYIAGGHITYIGVCVQHHAGSRPGRYAAAAAAAASPANSLDSTINNSRLAYLTGAAVISANFFF